VNAYCDYNAGAPVRPEAAEAVARALTLGGNASSVHRVGRRARAVVEDAREQLGLALSARPNDIVFTSGATEALHLAVEAARAADPDLAFVRSAIEHDALAELSCDATFGASRDGVADLEHLDKVLAGISGRPLVALMAANNETGVVQPVAELAAIFGENGVPLHTDAAQAAGKLPIDFRKLGAATLTIAAHKFGGPVGIGALLVRNDIELQPQLFGGFQQAGTRPGTEAVALAVGMRTALELWEANRAMWTAHLRQLRDHFEEQLLAAGALESCRPVVIGASAERLPHTSNIAFVGLDRQQLFLALDQAGVACSTGSACASGSSEPSPAHLAMGLDAGVISSALRFSFGVSTTREEVAEATCRIIKVCNHLRR
jgi:cysteine desulfurase